MEFATGQNVNTQKETCYGKYTVRAQNAAHVVIVLGLFVFLIDGFERPNILLMLKELLKIVIAVEIQPLIDQVYDTRILVKSIINYWVQEVVVWDDEAGGLQINTIFNQSRLKYHAAYKVVVRADPVGLIYAIEIVLHLLYLVIFEVNVRVLQHVEVNFVNYSGLKGK